MMNARAKSKLLKNRLEVGKTIKKLFEDDLHAKRVESIANGVVGVVNTAVLSIHAIGRAYAQAVGGNKKHGVKQIDRLLSNSGVDVWELFPKWVGFVVGPREELVIALDWTDFDDDDHTTLAAHLITTHGRATPLIWMTVPKSTLEGEPDIDSPECMCRCLATSDKTRWQDTDAVTRGLPHATCAGAPAAPAPLAPADPPL